jgi:hypothetical protein
MLINSISSSKDSLQVTASDIIPYYEVIDNNIYIVYLQKVQYTENKSIDTTLNLDISIEPTFQLPVAP